MSLFLGQRTIGSIVVLELGEELKAEHVPEFRDTVQRHLDQGHSYFLMDCSRIRKADSVGIGCLVGMWISVKKREGKLGLLSPSARFQGVLKLVGLQDVIEAFDEISKISSAWNVQLEGRTHHTKTPAT